MNTQHLDEFREFFENQRATILSNHGNSSRQGAFQLRQEDSSDEADVASSELESSMRMRLCNRETLLLKKIDEALRRILLGQFGLCESCGEDIVLARLRVRPTATLCTSCKEEQEHREYAHIDGRKPKSVGEQFRPAGGMDAARDAMDDGPNELP